MSEEGKELEVKKENPIAISEDWGSGPEFSMNDFIIPKILPLQQMSDKVLNKQGEYGEFRDTVSNEKFGDLEHPVEFIPFYSQSYWIEFDMVKSKSGVKREFARIVPIVKNPLSPDYNDDLPLVDEENNIERDRVLEFYVLLPEQVKEGRALPYVLSFRRTSLRGGKKLMTQMYVKNKAAGIPPAGTVMKLMGISTQNDQGTFVVQDVAPVRPATKEEVDEALKWFKILRSQSIKVDHSELEREDKKFEQTEVNF